MDLQQLHEEYRRAVEAARDEAASDEARKAAQADLIDKRHALDAALIAVEEARADNERKAAVERAASIAVAAEAAGQQQRQKPAGLPIEEIRKYGMGTLRGETFSFRIEPERRADWTTIDTTTYSSYTVPQSYINSVYNFQIAQSGILKAGPRILNTANGNQINYPKLVTDMTTLAGVEGVAATETNPVFGTVPLNSYRVDGFTPISDELLRDSGVDIEALVMELAGRSIAAKVAAYYGKVGVGTGSSLPAALTIGTTLGVTAVSTTSPTLDEVKKLMYSVLPQYRVNGAFVANTTLTQDVALMKDDDGRYLWNPSVSSAEPDRLFGKPWYEDAYLDASTTGLKPLVFGDIGAAYIVRRIGGIEVSFSRDFAFTSFETTARWAMWHDAATIDTIAAKHLILA